MKILNTYQFVAERVKVKPITNIELDKAKDEIENQRVLCEIIKLVFGNKCTFVKKKYITSIDIDKKMKDFCRDSNNKLKKDSGGNIRRDIFIELARKNNGMFYIAWTEPYYGGDIQEALVVDNRETDNKIYVLYAVQGGWNHHRDAYEQGHTFVKTYLQK